MATPTDMTTIGADRTLRVTIIGAGNGGHAMAGHLAALGHAVTLYDRSPAVVEAIAARGCIELEGSISGTGVLAHVTDDLASAVSGANLIMVVTTADAHAEVASQLCPHLHDGQTVVLNPGRTGGVLEVKEVWRALGIRAAVDLAEAQSLVYASRILEPGRVAVLGVKSLVPLAGLTPAETERVIAVLGRAYDCFVPAGSVLETGLENIGAIFHPAITLLNAGTIDRGEKLAFYADLTPRVSEFVNRVDAERLAVGRAYGLTLTSAEDWVARAYEGVSGADLCEKIRSNPAYERIVAPNSLDSRQLFEDIPTGLVPICEFGRVAGIPTPLMSALVEVGSALLGRDFWSEGRTLARMGLAGADRARVESVVGIGQ